jgi:hypothetical protein
MAKMSLLDVVQEILSDMNSDAVNSISDTVESQQVAIMAKRCFFNMINERYWPNTGELLQVDSLADNSRPNYLILPDDVISIDWIKYDSRVEPDDVIKFNTVNYYLPAQFLEFVMNRDATNENTQVVMDIRGTPLIILNDQAPTMYTMFDDKHLVFDSYNNKVDSVLQASKSQVFGFREPVFEMKDNFVPNMPSKMFPYWVAETKSNCFLNIKEVFNQKVEQTAGRQRAWLSRNKSHKRGIITYPNYGRNSGDGRIRNNTGSPTQWTDD